MNLRITVLRYISAHYLPAIRAQRSLRCFLHLLIPLGLMLASTAGAIAQIDPTAPPPTQGDEGGDQSPELPATDQDSLPNRLDLDPAVIENSPVLQQWIETVPDISHEIIHDPSFRTRVRLGYSRFPSTGQADGFNAGVEDIFVWPGTGLTLSGDYARSWSGSRESYGATARYYLFPLGGFVNFAPVVGYRSLSTPAYTTDGLDVGMQLMIVPSRGGGADIALSQTWVAPGTQDEVGMTGVTIGYAVTHQLRLATDFQFQNSRFGQDSRVGIGLEWMP